MDSNVFFYSERGLINCLVLDLKNDAEKTKYFLKLIKFGIDEQTPEWVDKVISVDWYVEFSASEFGNPDLIADIHCTDGHRVIFFEAKLKSYIKTSAEIDFNQNFNSENDGILKGKTSTINAQLALRYRLANTLKLANWVELQNSEEPQLEERRDIAIQYKDMFKAIRQSKTGRRIHNDKMIAVFGNIMKSNPDFYFVAMTFETEEHIFKMVGNNNPNLLPPIGIDQWNSENRHFGILNFNDFIKLMPVSENSFLSSSRDYIYPKSQTSQTDDNDYSDEELSDVDIEETIEAEPSEESSKDRIRQKGWPNANIYVDWFDKLHEIPGIKLRDNAYNCSVIKKDGTSNKETVMIKLIYKNNNVYIGFRDKLPDEIKNKPSIVISFQGKRFISVLANTISVETIKSFISLPGYTKG